MTAGNTLPDLLGRTSEVRGEEVLYRFANGLTIKTEVFNKDDALRILPLGSPQCGLMNHMVNFPEIVRDKHVFEPFAGSGPLGFMALMLGARHVDFLDINPRAAEFHYDTAQLNQLSSARFTSIVGDIANFIPSRKYDLIVANPPFVPTPEGIDGTITSNGGPEGNRFVEILFQRLEEFLEASGEALIYLFQFAKDEQPLVVELISKTLDRRLVELTPSQKRRTSFEAYRTAYVQLFPNEVKAIERWESNLVQRYGKGLTLCHYIAHVGPEVDAPTSCVIRDNFPQKFGESCFVPSDIENQLALGRVLENVIRGTR
jgi:methyltransferase family protein